MIGDLEKMEKRNQNSFATLEQKNGPHRKRNRILLCIAMTILLTFLSVVFYLWKPAVCTEIIGFFWPDDQYTLTVRIGSKDYNLPLFYKRWAHERLNGAIEPAFILCNIPAAEGLEHIKIFPDCLGSFQFPKAWFSVGRFSLMIREGARMTMPLEDDMKGWDTEYHIQHRNGAFHFTILPWQRNKEIISFSIPEKLMKRVPCFGKQSAQESLSGHQVIKPSRLLKK